MSGHRGGGDLTAIQALIDAGSVDFEWDGSPEYDPGFTATSRGLALVANEQKAPGTMHAYIFDIADAAGDTDIMLPSKFEVHEVRGFKTGGPGGAGDTAQVKNTADAITDAISLNVADAAALVAATYDDAFSVVAAGGTLRVTIVDGNAGATDLSCRLVVSGVLRA